ncbi:hypothetical protein G3479_03520 [Shewanella baltica]|nr:hypothetical protein [Shewanella baltica]MCS6180359.1 hypothetical protein [Shewanella baltica]MCS6258334.1 hypothetical protein [Shewanella baltica]
MLPLKGMFNIEVDTFKGKVTPGERVVVKAGEMHYFTAEHEANFVVADLDNRLPFKIAVAAKICRFDFEP